MEFLKSILSNDSGTGSSNRVGLMIIVIALTSWASISVWRTGTIPDISTSWLGILGIFVGGTSFGKAADAVTAIKAPMIEESTEEVK